MNKSIRWIDKETGLEWYLYDGRFDINRTWPEEDRPEDLEKEYRLPTIEQVKTIMNDERIQHLDVWTCEEFNDKVAWACNFVTSRIYRRDKVNRKHPLYVK